MDTGPLVQPGRQVEELAGDLQVPDDPVLSAGYADIYHGVWTRPDGVQVQVAVKELKGLIPKNRQTEPEALRRRTDIRMKREVFAWSQTTHPNLHPLLGYRSKPRPRLISPWCRHGNLTDYLLNHDLSKLDKLRLILQTGRALFHLHSQAPPICHADIKPENVLINDCDEASLSDFGLSRVLQDFDDSSGLTTSGDVKGTLNYMAGELFRGEKPGRETDVYAFGGLILTVMSAKPPYFKLPKLNIMLRATTYQPPIPEDHPNIPPSDTLWILMGRCWSETPAARPTMREVLGELDRYTSIIRSSSEPIPCAPSVVHNDVGEGFSTNLRESGPTPASRVIGTSQKTSRLLFPKTIHPIVTITAVGSTDNQPSFIDPKDKQNEILGTFRYDDTKTSIIRDLTEIHEVTWTRPDNKTLTVHVKYLRYATIIEGDIYLTYGDKKRELKRILDQMKTWTSLKHRNILPFFGYQWKETPILVFSWYKNGNVFQYLRCRPDADRLKLLTQVAQGLSFLHNKSIVHGDIRPSNIIIADDGHAMLMDFGMAPDLRMVERNMALVDSGRDHVGYMSPELAEEVHYTQAADVYAFGALILEIMSGHPPFYKLPFIQVMIQITKRAKPTPDDHQELSPSSPFWDLMQHCWTSMPEDRPCIDEVRGVLERMVKRERSGLFGYFSSLDGLPFRLVGLA